MSDRNTSLVVSPGSVSLDELAQVLAGAPVVLDPSFWPRVEAASAIVARAAGAQAPVYGINTGFGKLASKRIPPDQTALLQRNLIVSHCCGVGAPTPEPIVRLPCWREAFVRWCRSRDRWERPAIWRRSRI
jgi:histidine ammonia-lyase